jgi:glycosyltransferase involved in cell wall biosynthesis
VAVYETIRALARLPGLDMILYGTREPLIPFSGSALDIDLRLRIGKRPLAWSNIAWLQYGASSMLQQDGIDAFWGTRQVLPRNAPSVAKVVTLYDFWHIYHPEQQPIANRALNRHVMQAAVGDADLLTAISEDAASDARRFFALPHEKVRAVLLGVDAVKFASPGVEEVDKSLERMGVIRPYVLAMDVYNPRKNVLTLLKAVATFDREMPQFQIAALGLPRKTAREVHVSAEANALGLAARLRLLGDVGLSDLRVLYAAAEAFVYPSVYEGFGMPVLEAMAAGTPVITSRTSSIPEVAGDSAITVDPMSAPELAAALRRVIGDTFQREKMRKSGRDRAMGFTWKRTAEGMRQAFEDAVAASAKRRN